MSNSDTCAALGPRPWYVSVTIRWKELDKFGDLEKALKRFLETEELPVHHVVVPRKSWHSTILAVLKMNRVPARGDSFSRFATSLFTELLGYSNPSQGLAGAFKPIDLVAHEVRCYDAGTTVQFEDSKALGELRTRLQDFFRPHIGKLVGSTVSAYGTPAVVESLLGHETKSWGTTLFGSIARSACRADSQRDCNALRWVEGIGPVRLRCNRFHLLVSDEALTNPKRLDENDVSFP